MTDVWEWEMIAEHGSLTEGPTWGRQRVALQRVLRGDDFFDGIPKTGESAVWRTEHRPSKWHEVRPVGAIVRV